MLCLKLLVVLADGIWIMQIVQIALPFRVERLKLAVVLLFILLALAAIWLSMIPVLYVQHTMPLGANANKTSMQLHAIQDTISVQGLVQHAQIFMLVVKPVMLILTAPNAPQDILLIAISTVQVALLIV